MSRATLIIGFLLLNAAVGHGCTKFNPNCTSPDHLVNFVQSPGGRGTLDILWSCLFTIVACTWTILHINVPEQREGQNPGWRGDLKWMFKGFWIKLWWMLWTILAPELVLSVAVGNLSRARDELLALKTYVEQDGVPWSLTHSLFANMGGFVLRGTQDMQTLTRIPPLECRLDPERLCEVGIMRHL